MTQEDKELLLKDLSSRLPYGVKVAFFNEDLTYHSEPKTLTGIECINNLNYSSLEDEDGNTTIVEFVKPYLFPLSSMTEEQLYNNPIGFSQMLTIKADRDWENITINRRAYYKLVDWFNKNHFDYRGLIEKGLALDATGKNIYN